MVPLTEFPQNRSIEKDGRSWLRSACCKTPSVRWKHPRPTQQVSSTDCFDEHRFTEPVTRFENHFPALNQIKSISHFAFPKNRLFFFEVNGHRAICKQCKLCAIHSGQERMQSHTCGHRFNPCFGLIVHGFLLSLFSLSSRNRRLIPFRVNIAKGPVRTLPRHLCLAWLCKTRSRSLCSCHKKSCSF